MEENELNAWQRIAKMNPAVLRACIVAVVGIIAVVTGKAIDDSIVDTIVSVLMILLPIVAGFFIRKAVTPNAKVIAFQPNPIEEPHVIEAGEAVIQPEQQDALVDAAYSEPKAA